MHAFLVFLLRAIAVWHHRGLVVCLIATLCCGGFLGIGRLAAQRPLTGTAGETPPGGQLWISATPLDNARTLLIVVDPNLKNAAVYHIDGVSGTLTLKSARDITWDLLVGDFNAQEPKPAALKKMLEIGDPHPDSGAKKP